MFYEKNKQNQYSKNSIKPNIYIILRSSFLVLVFQYKLKLLHSLKVVIKMIGLSFIASINLYLIALFGRGGFIYTQATIMI